MKRRFEDVEVKCEVNFVPMIDVLLVLLFIFMATSPAITSNIHIDVPQVEIGETVDSEPMMPNTIIVSINAEAQLHLTVPKLGIIDEIKQPKEMSAFIGAVLSEEPNIKVYLRSDASLRYQTVADAMNLLKQSGSKSINLVTTGEHK